MLLDPCGEGGTADFLFPLEDELHVVAQLSAPEQELEGL